MSSIATTHTPFTASRVTEISEVCEYIDLEPGSWGRWAWVRLAHNGRRVVRRLSEVQVRAVA